MNVLEELNPDQKKAVLASEERVCVIAGPGCGKTKTLVSKVVNLIHSKESNPENILLLTFSKKAIKEIKERVTKLLGFQESFRLNIHNFHSFCYRFLRENYLLLGFSNDNFPIYDRGDQETILKKIFNDLDCGYDSKELSTIISIISFCKIKNGYADYVKKNDFIRYEIYCRYQKDLVANNAFDFNDLLNYTVRLLKENSSLKESYNFSHILVDEFQDVNDVQWEIVKLLTCRSTKIFIVGDPNQSIYGFQGSSPDLISSFIKDNDWFVVYLSTNYRSTSNIVKIGNSFLNSNQDSLVLNQLISTSDLGENVEIISNCSVRFVIRKIIYLIEVRKINPSQIAILYRNNYLSALIEHELIFNRIPYEILGSFKFIEREEIKDVLSYLKAVNFNDDASLMRILRITEGIGPKFIENLERFSSVAGLTIFNYLNNNIFELINGSGDWRLNKIQKESISNINLLFKKFNDTLKNKLPLVNFIESVINGFNYFGHLDKKNNAFERRKNIQQFLNIVRSWEKANNNFSNLRDSLNEFIQYCVIAFEDSSMSKSRDNLIISSVHQSKGLEFEVVFFLYLDENVLPYKNSTDLVEEKRIFYVGITRAKRKLYLVSNSMNPSEFLNFVS